MAEPARYEKKILSVSEVTRLIKSSLERDFPHVWIQGEISNCKQHSSGHYYFTLKDEGAQMSAVLWRSRATALSVNLEDGMKVQVRGAITVYAPRGNYQIDVLQVLPVGIGELQLAFERLKQKLAAEGLFDASRKKPLPEFPSSIGVVTSVTGAALHDILSVLSRRFPALEVVVSPVRVQGEGAAQEIVDALREMNRYGGVEVIIVGRGGGSLEDLWAFNEEVVARAIAASAIPVVSAVGHEIDFSISDFVADLRAPTPSAAAELIVRDRVEILELLRNICYTMRQSLEDRVSTLKERMGSLVSSYSFNRPKDLFHQYAQRLDELERGLSLASSHIFDRVQQHHEALYQQLQALSPRNVLSRGYAIIRKDQRPVTRAAELSEGDRAEIEFHDARVLTRVEKQ